MPDITTWLSEQGFNFEPVLDGKVRRFKTLEDENNKKSGWYVGSSIIVNNKKVSTITIGDWRSGEKVHFRDGEGFKNGDLEKYKKAIETQKIQQEKVQNEIWEETKKTAIKIWETAKSAPEENEYLKRKKVKSYGCKWDGQALIVPVYIENEISSIQRIFGDGKKQFLTGGRVKGGYFKLDGNNEVLLLVEGYATGATVFEAAGFTTYVAFNASNLYSVASQIRKDFPGSTILICGDDDHKTEGNPGKTKAIEAAQACGGMWIVPVFNEEEGTDFNDIHCVRGIDEVRRQIEQAIKGGNKGTSSNNNRPDERTDSKSAGAGGKKVGDGPEKREKTLFEKRKEACKYFLDADAIKFLGFSEGKHHYISKYSKKIVSLTPSAHTQLNLLELMGLGYWDMLYSKEYEKVDKKTGKITLCKTPIEWGMAADDLISNSLQSGFFEAGRIRGVGIYVDKCGYVINTGSEVITEKGTFTHSEFDSEYFYIPGPKIELPGVAASADDCLSLLDVGHMLLWNKPEDAYFFLGWLSCAVLSGALKWRPHLYITGSPGVGKSWVLENVVHPIIKQMSEYFLSNSSEAGIRQSLKNNALAVIWDEPEVNNESDNKNIQKVLALARQSSFESDGRVSRGTAGGSAMEFSIKSCFLLGSIKDAVQEGADLTRFTILNMVKKEDRIEAAAHFKKLESMVYALTDSDFPKRFVKRIFNSAKLFEECNKKLKLKIAAEYNSRIAQQYGALLAGYWIISNDTVITDDKCAEMVKLIAGQENAHHDWSEDIWECYEYLTAKIVIVDAVDGESGSVRMSIGEIINKPNLHDRLESYGLKVIHHKSERKGQISFFVCSKHPQLKELFRDSKWVSGWSRSFGKITGAKKCAQKISGMNRKGVEIPIPEDGQTHH